MEKILDIFAAICLAFNVDWDKEYEDDDYVLAVKAMRGETT